MKFVLGALGSGGDSCVCALSYTLASMGTEPYTASVGSTKAYDVCVSGTSLTTHDTSALVAAPGIGTLANQ